MELEKFTELFANQFEDTPSDEFQPETKFRDLDEWDSLVALSIIAMVDEEFDKQVSGAELRGVNTIKELYDLVQSK